MLGRAPYGTIENLRREEYNTLLRRAFRGREPIFDLARVESTAPDGTTASVNWNGHERAGHGRGNTPTTGGHLNAKGKLLAARGDDPRSSQPLRDRFLPPTCLRIRLPPAARR